MEPTQQDIRDVLWLHEIEPADLLLLVRYERVGGYQPAPDLLRLYERLDAAVDKLYPDQTRPGTDIIAFRAGWLD